MRFLIDIPDEEASPLAEVCHWNDISRPEGTRGAVVLFLQQHARQADAAFGLWKARGTDGVDYGNELRTEWCDVMRFQTPPWLIQPPRHSFRELNLRSVSATYVFLHHQLNSYILSA
jgi:hypothetical protein